MRPLICVGLAYFAIAVVVPVVLLVTRGEAGDWTARGIVWSLAGGAAGAIGALGIILAFNFGGKPAYVMPLVFGCAPVVNAFITMYWAGTWNEMRPAFLAGLILVGMGAMMVLYFAPKKATHPPSAHAKPVSAAAKKLLRRTGMISTRRLATKAERVKYLIEEGKETEGK